MNGNPDFDIFNAKMNKKLNLADFKKGFKIIGIIVAAIILLSIILNQFFYQVDEREQVIVKQFDKVVKIVINEKTDEVVKAIEENPKFGDIAISDRKGLHVKIPFIQSVERFTSMILTYDTESREVITKDKKKLVLDNYAVWRIVNPALFYTSLGNERSANTKLDDIIYSKLNEEIGKVDSHVVISDKEYVTSMLERVEQSTNEQMAGYGVEVVNMRIKRTDFPVDNHGHIFNRMNTERQKSAMQYRSEGQEEAQKIRSEADREATIIEAQAYEEAEKIRGEGDAEALRIYAEAYNRDPEFYAFWRTLQAYKKALKDNTIMIIDPDSEFARFLFDAK
ncbi:MAG: protease modulator HflC [Clostridiaceae bacterium]|nr:protease modulator HflC [Clostridiaceae bacterium]